MNACKCQQQVPTGQLLFFQMNAIHMILGIILEVVVKVPLKVPLEVPTDPIEASSWAQTSRKGLPYRELDV